MIYMFERAKLSHISDNEASSALFEIIYCDLDTNLGYRILTILSLFFFFPRSLLYLLMFKTHRELAAAEL